MNSEEDISRKCAALAKAAASGDLASVESFLTFVNINKIKDDALVVALGAKCRQKHGSAMGDSFWTILEQTAQAALRIGDVKEASACYDALSKKFGESSKRVQRLQLQIEEVKGDKTKAESGYTAETSEPAEGEEPKPPAPAAQKRLIALALSKNQTDKALRLLRDYVEGIGAADYEAWLELCELNVSKGALPQAIFCLEEMVLLDPSNAATHTRLAHLLCVHYGKYVLFQGSASKTNLRAFVSGLESNGADILGNLRQARLNASQAVQLTKKQSAYALVTLACASYLYALALALLKSESLKDKNIVDSGDASQTYSNDMILGVSTLKDISEKALKFVKSEDYSKKTTPKKVEKLSAFLPISVDLESIPECFVEEIRESIALHTLASKILETLAVGRAMDALKISLEESSSLANLTSMADAVVSKLKELRGSGGSKETKEPEVADSASIDSLADSFPALAVEGYFLSNKCLADIATQQAQLNKLIL